MTEPIPIADFEKKRRANPDDRFAGMTTEDIALELGIDMKSPPAEKGAQAAVGIVAAPYSWRKPADIPPRQFLYGRHLIRGFPSCTIAPGGIGKTSLLVTDALAMGTGRNLVGSDVPRPLNVWIWNGEDPLEEMERRVAAAARHYGITPADCPGRLFLNSGRDTPIIVARQEVDGTAVAVPVVEAMIETIRGNQIDVVIIDPFVSCHKAPENDNNAIDLVVKEAWAKIADATSCALDLVHHTRKAGGEEITVEHARGASALIAGSRSARVLNVMTKEEALKARVGDARRLHFNVTNGKSNMASPSDKRDWFKLESVDLGNGDAPGQGDLVGVVTPWEWPDALEGMTIADLLAVQTAIDGRELRLSVQANDWVGHVIGETVGVETSTPEGKERVKQMIQTWIKSGALVEEKIKGKDRKERPVVRVGTWANT